MVDRSDNTFEGNTSRKAPGTGDAADSADDRSANPSAEDTEHVDGPDSGTSGASRPRGKTGDPDKSL